MTSVSLGLFMLKSELYLLNSCRQKDIFPESLGLVETLIDRNASLLSINLSSAYFTIKRIQSSTPVSLFGEILPVYVYNQLSFYDADKTPLLSVNLSESSLSKIVFGQDSLMLPLTTAGAHGIDFPAYQSPSIEESLSQNVGHYIEQFDDNATSGLFSSIHSSSVSKEVVNSLLFDTQKIGDIIRNKSLEQYTEAEINRLFRKLEHSFNQNVVNTLHTSNADVQRDVSVVDVEELSSMRDEHPMINSLLGEYSSEEKYLLRQLLENHLHRLLEEYGLSSSDIEFNESLDVNGLCAKIDATQYSVGDFYKKVRFFGSLHQFLYNKDYLMLEQHHDMHQLVSFVDYKQSIIEFDISTAYHQRHDLSDIRDVIPLLGVIIDRDQLLNALRDPSGESYATCRVKSVCKYHMEEDFFKEKSYAVRDEFEINDEIEYDLDELRKSHYALKQHLSEYKNTQKYAKELDRLKHDFLVKLGFYRFHIKKHILQQYESFYDEFVKKIVSNKIKEISDESKINVLKDRVNTLFNIDIN